MKVGTLSRRHPASDHALFQRYDALYRGGVAFRSRIKDFLPQNPAEPAGVYALRVRDAAYRSYVGPICDFFAAQLFAAPFIVRAAVGTTTKTADPFYAAFREDCDGNGTDLVTLLKAQFTGALVKQASWMLAEMPDDDGITPQSRDEWDSRGLGFAKLRGLDACDVLDWEHDESGAMLWAITHKREARRTDPRTERTLVTDTWRLYDATDVETFSITYDPKSRKPKAEDDVPSVSRRAHGFTRVPLVCMRLPDGLWLLNRAADAQTDHFRSSAALTWALRRACYPMAVFKSKGGDDPMPLTGSGYAVKINVDESFDWVAPSSAPFEVLAAEIDTCKTEIYRVTNQMAASVNNNAAALGRSGYSKHADMAATEICLHAYATHVKAALEEVYELVSDARGDVEVRFSIEGLDKFNMESIAAALANIKAAKDLAIPSPTLKRELGAKAADMLLPDASQATKDQIRKEIEEADTERAPALPMPPEPPAALVDDSTDDTA